MLCKPKQRKLNKCKIKYLKLVADKNQNLSRTGSKGGDYGQLIQFKSFQRQAMKSRLRKFGGNCKGCVNEIQKTIK